MLQKRKLVELHDYIINVSIRLSNGMKVMSLSASLHHKTGDTTDCVYHIALNENYHILSKPNHVKPNITA